MLKKSLYVGGAAVLLMGLLFGRNASSYVRTTIAKVSDSVKHSVPLEFEIDRARNMIKDLTPEIRRNMHLIAKEEIQVEHLERQVLSAEKTLVSDRNDIMRLKSELDGGGDHVYLAGHRYTSNQVKADLASRFTHYKTSDATTVNLRKVLHARQNSLDAAREKLNGMLVAKRQLEVDVENLEARMKMIEVAQTTSDFNFDDSHLARTKELLRDIQTRIEVGERLLNTESMFQDRIPLDEPVVEDVSEEIAAYFDEGTTHEEIVAALAEFSAN
jgi:predicted  nucleic acid-binding Zn-ribbon protein